MRRLVAKTGTSSTIVVAATVPFTLTKTTTTPASTTTTAKSSLTPCCITTVGSRRMISMLQTGGAAVRTQSTSSASKHASAATGNHNHNHNHNDAPPQRPLCQPTHTPPPVLDAAGVWVGGGSGAMRAAVEAVLRRCACEEVTGTTCAEQKDERKDAGASPTPAAAGVPITGDPSVAVTMVLREVYRLFSTPRERRDPHRNDNYRATSNQTLTELSRDIIHGNWERIAHRFSYALRSVPEVKGQFALPAEEIAAVARDVGHPLRQLVNQISYAEHGAVDVSGLYRQVQHAAYAPPVVVPDAEVAAFAQCLLQQTGAIEHALAASTTATTTTAAETTPKRPKKTKRARSSSSSKQEEISKEPATTGALLDIFNQAVRACVPTCAQWSFTDAVIADVTAAARAVVAAANATHQNQNQDSRSTSSDATAVAQTLLVGSLNYTYGICKIDAPSSPPRTSPDQKTAADDEEEATRAAIAQRRAISTIAAARRVLEALVAANGRILGTITLQGAPPTTTSPSSDDDVTAMCSNDDNRNDGIGEDAPPLLSWFTHLPGKAARADTVYVRAVYEELWALLSDPQSLFGWDLPESGRRASYLLLVGSPGIGKSWALNYLLYKAVTEERAGCPKRLVMLWGVGGLWAFLPDGRVIHGGLRGPTHQHPPKAMIEELVARYAPIPAAANVNPSDDGPKAIGATPTSDAADPTQIAADASRSSNVTAPLPALLLYDLGMERVESLYVSNMITVVAASPPESKVHDVTKRYRRTNSTFFMPPFGEHEFKAFFKGHPDVECTRRGVRFINESKKDTKDSGAALSATEAGAADALVAEEYEKYGGVLQGAFDGQQASRVQHALDEAVAEAAITTTQYAHKNTFWYDPFAHTSASTLLSIFPKRLEPEAGRLPPLPAHEFGGYSVGFRSKHIESMFEQQLERAIALVAVRREMDELGWPREY